MNKKELEMKRGESYMCNGYEVSGICSYNSGQRFLGLNVKLDIELLMSLINSTGKEYRIIEQFNKNNLLFKKKFTSSIGIILNDIIRCRYRHSLKRVYLEGKILELIAVYMDEMVNENGAGNSAVKLSSYDMEALYKAKMVLDEDIVSPPTLAGLARRVCLNEYKLKKGFKELFGIPVHAYVIDKRLEMARFLIEDKRLKVTEAALFVGYNDASHFAEKFKKKYGINPSEYIKSL
jgi:AraC-like DNA-binding protein